MNELSIDELLNRNRQLERNLALVLHEWDRMAEKFRSVLSCGVDFFDPLHEGGWNYPSLDCFSEPKDILELFSEFKRLFEERRKVLNELGRRDVRPKTNPAWEALIKKFEK